MKVSKYLDPDIIKDGTIDVNKIKNYPPLEKGTGENSVVQKGGGNKADGKYSSAVGDHTTASGYVSHSEGSHTVASGPHSHSEGDSTTASGNSSHAEGSNTQTTNMGEHAEGKFNKSVKDKTIHTVGIGTSDNDSNRKNAHEIHLDGKHYIFGIGGYDGKNSQTEGVKTVQEVIEEKADKSYVDTETSKCAKLDEINDFSADSNIFREIECSLLYVNGINITSPKISDSEESSLYMEYRDYNNAPTLAFSKDDSPSWYNNLPALLTRNNPTIDIEAVNKKYVDDKYTALESRIAELENIISQITIKQ